MKLSRTSCLRGAALVVLASRAEATDKTWSGSDGGFFSSAGNWTPSGVPGSSDAAIVDVGTVVFGMVYDISFSIPNPFPPPTFLAGNSF